MVPFSGPVVLSSWNGVRNNDQYGQPTPHIKDELNGKQKSVAKRLTNISIPIKNNLF